MNELVVIVEGETEQTFVRDQLAAHLAMFGTIPWGVLPGRKRKHGGVKKWEIAQKDIIRTLKERRYCTTMMDYYALPSDWPGRVEAPAMRWDQRAAHVESRVSEEIETLVGHNYDARFFIPYIQLHEFEALAFADVEKLASVVAPLSNRAADDLQQKYQDALDEAGHPEAINDGYETCPSRRISGLVKAYRERIHGPLVTSRTGLQVLRDKCHHFASWLDRLERIGAE